MKEYYLKALQSEDTVLQNGWENKQLAIERYLFVTNLVNVIRPDKVYDYGCGTGNLSEYIRIAKYIGIDEMQEMIDVAQTRFDSPFHVGGINDVNVGVYCFHNNLAVSLGIYNAMLPIQKEEDIYNIVLDHIEVLCKRHQYGYIFNAKHDRVTYVEDDRMYFDLFNLMIDLKKKGYKVSVYLFDKYEFFLHVKI